jgi:hypothetical protein
VTSLADQLLGSLNRIAKDALRTAARQATGTVRKATGARRPSSDDRHAPKLSIRYPGDFKGRPQITYAPHTGKTPDPGEVVSAWVPDDVDHTQGKDGPVLLVGRDGDWLLGVVLAAVDSEADAEHETRERWVTIGTGAWDARRRPTRARVDRIVRVHPDDVRGRAEKLDKTRFDKVVAGIRKTAV